MIYASQINHNILCNFYILTNMFRCILFTSMLLHMSFHTDASHAGDIFCWTMMTLHWRVLIWLGLFRTLYDVSILGDSCIVRVYTYTVLVRNQRERRKWKITLNEMKLILEGPIFHFHDYGRKSIFGANVVISYNLSVPCFEQSVLSMCTNLLVVGFEN